MLFLWYPKCTTCQKAKAFLDERGVSYEARDIKLENPTAEELRGWWGKSGMPLKKFFNTSGLQYKVITMGTGEKPQSTDRVKVDYEGRLIDGTVFDSSYKRGKAATFPVNQVIPGWTEVLCLMPVGSKWEVYIPQELGYKDHEQQKIPPFSCLVFTVELHEIVK